MALNRSNSWGMKVVVVLVGVMIGLGLRYVMPPAATDTSKAVTKAQANSNLQKST